MRDGLLKRREIWLNLGDVREIASVSINRVAVQTLWRPPFLVRIDRQLRAGDNTVEIHVTDRWPNRLIGDLQASPKMHYAHTNIRAYTADSPLLPSGLLRAVQEKFGRVQTFAGQ